MGRIVPWYSYRMEWQQIRDQRRQGSIIELKAPDGHKKLLPDSSSSSSSSFRFPRLLPPQIASFLHLPQTKHYSEQQGCPLFRLPPEVRRMIWEYALGDDDVNIVRKKSKSAHVVLPRDKALFEEAERKWRERGIFRPIGAGKWYPAGVVMAEVDLLVLLLTCKRIYLEALVPLYRRKFSFTTMDVFYRFLVLSPMVGHQAVRSLEFGWPCFRYWERFREYRERDSPDGPLEQLESWEEICDAIVAMKNLRELRIFLLLDDVRSSARVDDNYHVIYQIALPLRRLASQVTCTVTIPLCFDRFLDLARRCEARLHKEGCKNVRVVENWGSEDIESDLD